MLPYITLSACIAVSALAAFVVRKNFGLVFLFSVLLTILPVTYVVHGTWSVVSELDANKVLGDIGAVLSNVVQEPIRLLQHQENVQMPFAVLGFLLLASLLVGFVQAMSSKTRLLQEKSKA